MDLSPSKRVVARRLSLIYILFIGGVGFLSVDLFRTYSEKEVMDFNRDVNIRMNYSKSLKGSFIHTIIHKFCLDINVS